MEETRNVPRQPGPRTGGETSQPSAGRERVNAATMAYVLRLRAELEEERSKVQARGEQVARLEGALSASDRVEAAAQRYADRLEEKLDQSRRREATLAREVGRLELRAERAEKLLAAPAAPEPTAARAERKGWFARLTAGRRGR